MQIIPFKNLVSTPWKNGKGTTRQIIRYPEDSTLDDFIFRVSIASVTETGPFSSYPKIDRSLAVLEGSDLELNLNNKIILFIPQNTIIHFDGVDKAVVTACQNDVLDFGVMSRQGLAIHTLEKMSIHSDESFTRKMPYTLLFSLNPSAVCIKINNEIITLNQYDSLLFTPEDHQKTSIQTNDNSKADFFMAEFKII